MLYGPWSLYAHVIVTLTTMPCWCIDDFLYKDSKSVLNKEEQFLQSVSSTSTGSAISDGKKAEQNGRSGS